jgi:hypothetical protein
LYYKVNGLKSQGQTPYSINKIEQKWKDFMLVNEILADDKLMGIKIKAKKKKKNNPTKSKTTKLGSFIDVFGGMANYPDTTSAGSINPSAQST